MVESRIASKFHQCGKEKSLKRFDFKIDIHGAVVIPAGERLSTASLSDAEIDAQILALKNDLDRVANEMKSAARNLQKQPRL